MTWSRLPGLILACLVLAAAPVRGAEPAPAPAPLQPVALEFFYQPGCSECQHVREEVFPELGLRYEGFYTLEQRDIGVRENYLRLAAYQEKLGLPNAPVSLVADGREALAGFEAIRDGIFPLLDRLVQERLSGASPPPSPAAEPAVAPAPAAPAGDGQAGDELLHKRAQRFTLAGVLAAGLVDGINPCAISTLVFFISLLSVLKFSGRRLIMVGVAFCTASFLTYLAIGFGMMRFIQLFSGYAGLRSGINAFMVGLLAVFAVLSFLDAWRFHRTRRSGDVQLQLPESVKLRIHRIMRGGLGTRSLVAGSLFIGAAVTVLESVCTGQVYLPTLVMLIKSGSADLATWLYLLLYNLMFQVPIVVVFLLTVKGLKTAELMSFSKKSVVASKVVMGLFFLGMALLILLL